jgi:hypothetical protein
MEEEAELAESPRGRWIRGDIDVQRAVAADLESDEDKGDAEGCGRDDTEITSHQGLGVKSRDGRLSLATGSEWSSAAAPRAVQVPAALCSRA